MVSQWQDPDSEDVALLSELSYDGDLTRIGFTEAIELIEEGEKRQINNPGAAARAAESLAYLDRTAPLLAWPLVLCVFLHHLPDDAKVELVLTEDAVDEGTAIDLSSATEYAAAYWSDASDWLAREARALERLFAVLAGSSAAAGTEFWFARAADLLGRVKSLSETSDVTTRARGDALESLVDAILRTEEPELQVIEKNLRTTEEEIDLVLTNGLSDPFWSSFASPLVLVECKNWKDPVGVKELRVLESKMRDRKALCGIGIFVALNGFTRPFKVRLKSIQADVGIIFAIDGDELAEIVATKRRLTNWLRDEGLRRALGGAS